MATITQINLKDGAKNISAIREKEIIKGYKSIIIDGEKAGKELIDVRFYMSRSSHASTVYCIVWIKDDKTGNWYSGKVKREGMVMIKEVLPLLTRWIMPESSSKVLPESEKLPSLTLCGPYRPTSPTKSFL